MLNYQRVYHIAHHDVILQSFWYLCTNKVLGPHWQGREERVMQNATEPGAKFRETCVKNGRRDMTRNGWWLTYPSEKYDESHDYSIPNMMGKS